MPLPERLVAKRPGYDPAFGGFFHAKISSLKTEFRITTSKSRSGRKSIFLDGTDTSHYQW